MKFFSAFLIGSILSSSVGYARDVKPLDVRPLKGKKERFFIKVTKNSDKTVSFDKCEIENENSCWQLGNRSSYEISELKKIRRHYKRRGHATAGAEAAVIIVAGVATAGVFTLAMVGAGGAFTSANIAGTAGYSLLVAGGTGAGLAGLNSAVDAVNPFKQFDRAGSVSDAIIEDRPVFVENMSEVIKNVDHVLKTI